MPRSLPCVILIFFISLNCSDKHNLPLSADVLARVGDRVITVQDFIRRAEYTIRPVYCRQSNYVHKKIVLNSLIAEKLTAIEMSEKKDDLLQSQYFHNYLTGRKEQSMRQVYYNDNFFSKTVAPDSTIEKLLPISGRSIEVNYINLPDLEAFNKIQELLKQKFSLPDIYNNIWGGEIPKRVVKFFDKEPDFIHEQLFKKNIKKGQLIGPFTNDDGSFLIMNIVGWTDKVSITEAEQEILWNDVKDMVKEKIAKKKYLNNIKEIMSGKKINFNPTVFDQYSYEASKTYLQDADSKKNAINKALWEEIENPKTVTLNNNSKIFPDDVILEYDNKQWTVKDINQLIQKHPLVFRKRTIGKSQFRNQLKLSLADLLRDQSINKECYKIGLEKDWRVKSNVSMWRDAYASKRFVSMSNKGSNHNGTVLYNDLVDSLQNKYSNRIKINTDIFEKIGLTSTDMIVTQRGLAYPIIVPSFPILTSDDRLDYGSKIN
tara:strand:+ start:73 stop:1536 length:1464 start_codon:yes stop_codon:yes gene_type:complete